MSVFVGQIVSVKDKYRNSDGSQYLGVTLKDEDGSRAWFGTGTDLRQALELGATVHVEYQESSNGHGIVFLRRTVVREIDGETIEQKPEPLATVNVGDFQGVVALFRHSMQTLRRPKIKVVIGGVRIKLYVAGPASKYHGQIQVVEDVPYGHGGAYFGRISQDGVFTQGRAAAPEELVTFLRELATNPAETAAKHGKACGNCVFCWKELSDERSLAVGYGPICAGNYGLPWGAKAS